MKNITIILLVSLSLSIQFRASGQLSLRPGIGLNSSRLFYTEEISQECKYYSENFDKVKMSLNLTLSKELMKNINLNLKLMYLRGEINGNDKFYCFTDYNPEGNKFSYIGINPQIEYKLIDQFIVGIGFYSNINTKSIRKDRSFGHYFEQDFKEYTKLNNYGLSFSLGYQYKQFILLAELMYNLNEFSEFRSQDRLNWIALTFGYELEISRKS